MSDRRQVFIGTDCGATMSKFGGVWDDGTTISTRLAKPLSARILPVRGLRAGEMTSFDSPYLCNSRVMAVTPGQGRG